MTGKHMAEAVVALVRRTIAKTAAALTERIDALESKLAAVPAGQRGDDGKSAYELAVADGFAGTQKEWVNSLRGADGIGTKGDPGEPGRDGRDGRDGDPGRDALTIEVLPEIDSRKSYARGTYASHRGGLVRSMRATDPLDVKGFAEAGWAVVVEGIADLAVDQVGERGFAVRSSLTSGKQSVMTMALPAMVYRGVWREGTFQRGDTVTRAGSLWHCDVESTTEAPGDESKHWTLCTKRGRDGKSGAPGRDLTKPQPVRV